MSETHPEPAELAALDEDLLTPSETAALREHLTRCVACTATLQELALLRQSLPELSDPGPIPDDVVFRIDAALAAEAARPSERPPLVSRETAGSTRRYSRARLALAAAGAALAVGIGGVVLEVMGPLGGSDGGGSTADSQAESDAAMRAPELPVESLEGQVRELLEDSVSPEVPENEQSHTEEPLPDTPPPTPPPSPTSAPSEEPTEGATEDPELVTAYVVDAQCVSATPPVTGEILLEESYPRE